MNAIGRLILCVTIGLFASTGLTGAEEAGKSKHGEFADESLRVGAATRTYRLAVPKSIDLTNPAPLVIAFHGMLIDSKDVMPKYTKLNETAEKHGFLLAYPEAIGKSWGIAPDKVGNDLAFFDALLEKLKGSYKVDPNRIYVLGMSNGGYFAHLVAKERSKTVAAAASHSGPLGLQALLGIKADRKFPVMIIHGDRDIIFPIAIARENRDKYKKEGHVVEYVEVPNFGHFWGTQVDVNEKMWAFFARHPLQ